MFHVTNRFELAEQSLKALSKLNATKQALLQENEEKTRLPKVNYAKFIFEEYDDQAFEKKVAMDAAR